MNEFKKEIEPPAPPELAPHQQRVVDEKRELDEKKTKLGVFLWTQTFVDLPAAEQYRLDRQWSAMHNYSLILGERIAAFGSTA